jgi:hypothetical protein
MLRMFYVYVCSNICIRSQAVMPCEIDMTSRTGYNRLDMLCDRLRRQAQDKFIDESVSEHEHR